MSAENPMELLARIMQDVAQAEAKAVLLVGDEPPALRAAGRLERSPGPPLSHEQLEAIAEAAVGHERVGRIGDVSGAALVTVTLPDGQPCSLTIARSGGQCTILARPMRAFVFEPAVMRLPGPLLRAVEEPGGGLVVVTGLPGCGKTTTCYGLLEHVNTTRAASIVCAEYASDFTFEAKRAVVQRRQIGVDAPDMETAIASAILQDVDVLFVGEIRDADVLAACVTAPESGRLVITQLHQPSPEAALRRMIELFPADSARQLRRVLARHLRVVAAQVLIPRADRPGRVPAYGVLVPDQAARNAIAQADSASRAGPGRPQPAGSTRLADDIADLRQQGIISAEAAAAAMERL